MAKVLFYERPGYYMSNFSAFSVFWRDARWMTSEHAYQAAKFDDRALIWMILNARSAQEAYALGREHDAEKRPNWGQVKLGIMEEILRAKLTQHPYIREKLLATGDAELIEDSPKDSFWGCGSDGNGQNHLGKLWMKLRQELRDAYQTPNVIS